MKRCPKCGSEYPDASKFCTEDASLLVDAAAPDAPARRVGNRFELGERVGGSRTGSVYVATDRESGSRCAVKLVADDALPSELSRQRAERELKQLTRLEDRSAVRVLAHGRQDGSLWLACQWVEGRPLGEALGDGTLSVPRAAAMARDLARALMTAAKLGVIHRDLSAKNVLVTPDGAPRLLNFALPIPGDTHPGAPEFAAPEQIEGKPLDQRSNIYSLGALVYLMVTGRPPYAGTPEAIREAHLAQSPPQPTGASEALDAVVLKALERNPQHRFMTLRQLMDRFAAIADEDAGEAASPSSTMPMGRAGDEAPAGERTRERRGKKQAQKPAAETLVGVPILSKQAQPPSATASGSESEPASVSGSVPESASSTILGTVSAEHVTVPAESSRAASGEGAPVAEHRGGDTVADPEAAARALADSDSSEAEPFGKRKRRSRRPSRDVARRARFRETMWFKRGDVDEAAAAAAEAASAAASEPLEEELYRDDGSLSDADQERYSLRTGTTQAMSTYEPSVDDVSEQDLIAEIRGARTKLAIAAAAVVVAVGLILLIAFLV